MRKFLLCSVLSSFVALSGAAEWETIQPVEGKAYERLFGETIMGDQGDSTLVWQEVTRMRDGELYKANSMYWETPIPVLCDYPDPTVMNTFGDGEPEIVRIKGVSSDHTAVYFDNPKYFRDRLAKEGSVMLAIGDNCGNQHTAVFEVE